METGERGRRKERTHKKEVIEMNGDKKTERRTRNRRRKRERE